MDLVVKHLMDHGIRSSVQRVAIMRYLMEHRTHPTVEDIYRDLHDEMPTLSKTTIYNTLSLLGEKDALSLLTIDSKNIHYDGDVSPHAHFLCRCCHRIFDVALPLGLDSDGMMPVGFSIEHSHVYYDGVCNMCSGKGQE